MVNVSTVNFVTIIDRGRKELLYIAIFQHNINI